MGRTKSKPAKRSRSRVRSKAPPNVVRNMYSVYQTIDGDKKGRYKKACDLVCIRCLYRKRNMSGPRCKNIVCFGLPYCTDHMKIMYNLELKPFPSSKAWEKETDPKGFYEPTFNKQYSHANFRIFAIDESPKDSGKSNEKQVIFQAGEIIISNEDADVRHILRKELKYKGKIGHGRHTESTNAPAQYENEAGGKGMDFTCVRSIVSMIRQASVNNSDGSSNANVQFISDPAGFGIVAIRDIFNGEELLLDKQDYSIWGDPMSAEYVPDQKAGYAIVRKRKGQTLPEVLKHPVRGWGLPKRDSVMDDLENNKRFRSWLKKTKGSKSLSSLAMKEDELSMSSDSSLDSLSDSDTSSEDSDFSDFSEPTAKGFASAMRDSYDQYKLSRSKMTPEELMAYKRQRALRKSELDKTYYGRSRRMPSSFLPSRRNPGNDTLESMLSGMGGYQRPEDSDDERVRQETQREMEGRSGDATMRTDELADIL